MKQVLAILSLSLCASVSSLGQSASERAKEYYEVFKSGEYGKAADFFAPQALADFREMMDFVDEIPVEGSAQFYSTFFGPGATKETVTALSDSEYFSGFLAFVMRQAEMAGGINFDGVEILGEIPEGEDVMHVLTRNRISMGEMEVEAMEVVSFQKVEGEWKTILSGKMKGMAAQLQKAFNP